MPISKTGVIKNFILNIQSDFDLYGKFMSVLITVNYSKLLYDHLFVVRTMFENLINHVLSDQCCVTIKGTVRY